jgi:hypothetical protein
MLTSGNLKRSGCNLLVAALFGVSLAGIAIQPAHAADQKVFPGSMCVRYAGPGLTVEPLDNSSIFNNSGSAVMRVDCPIMKTRPRTGLSRVWVRVIDQHPTQNVVCRLVNSIRSGSNWSQRLGPSRQSSGNSPNRQSLQAAPVNPVDGWASELGHWYVSCSIPPLSSGRRSHIINYWVDER